MFPGLFSQICNFRGPCAPMSALAYAYISSYIFTLCLGGLFLVKHNKSILDHFFSLLERLPLEYLEGRYSIYTALSCIPDVLVSQN